MLAEHVVGQLLGSAADDEVGEDAPLGVVLFCRVDAEFASASEGAVAWPSFVQQAMGKSKGTIENEHDRLVDGHKGGARMVRVAAWQWGEASWPKQIAPSLAITRVMPLVVCLGKGALRLGGNAWPFLGAGALAYCAVGRAAVVLLKTQGLIDAGMDSLDSATQFIQEQRKDDAGMEKLKVAIERTVWMVEGSALLVPFGVLPVCTSMLGPRGEGCHSPTVTLVVQPLFDQTAVEHGSAQCAQLVKQSISTWLALSKEKPPWSEVRAVVTAWLETLAPPS